MLKFRFFFALVAATSLFAVEEIEMGAIEANVQVVDHFLAYSQQDPFSPSDRSNLFLNEIFVDGSYSAFSLHTQLSNKLAINDINESVPVTLEKATAKAQFETIRLELGDSHHEFGRGTMLSLYRDDTFGINTTLLGASARYEAGALKWSLLAGKIHEFNNPVALSPTPSTLVSGDSMWIGGAEASYRLAENTRVGASYVGSLLQENGASFGEFSRRWNQFGVSLAQSELLENSELEVQASLLRYDKQSIFGNFVTQPLGIAGYAAFTYTPGALSLKWEVKENLNYDFDFRRPPTLEHDYVANVHSENSAGSRWSARLLDRKTRNEYSASYFLGWDRVENAAIHHGVIGAKFPEVLGLTTEIGYRNVPNTSNLAHGNAKIKIKTFKGQSIEFSVVKQAGQEALNVLPENIDRNRFDVAYSFSPKWSIGLGYEFVPTNLAAQGQHFVGAHTTLEIGPARGRAFVGQTSGGTQCSGGVCREVPPFNGAMLDTTITF